jgi:hypothetical protein
MQTQIENTGSFSRTLSLRTNTVAYMSIALAISYLAIEPAMHYSWNEPKQFHPVEIVEVFERPQPIVAQITGSYSDLQKTMLHVAGSCAHWSGVTS